MTAEQKRIAIDHMFSAIHNGDWQRFELCLKKGADINDQNALMQTPLMRAIIYGRDGWVMAIVKKGADVLKKDVNGKTAFGHASELTDPSVRKRITDILLNALPDADKTAVPDATDKKPIKVLRPLVFDKNKKKNNPPGGFRL